MRLFMYPHCGDEDQQSLGRAARIGALVAGLLAMPAAQAQASASIALASDYSVRGVSLSAGRPAAQLSLAYDAPQGWFAGAYAAPRVALGERTGVTQLVAYGGVAFRLASGLSWEAGASSSSFVHAAEYNYRELWAGVASDRLSARLYLAPAYYGYGGRVAYAEVNGFYPLRERIKLIVHAGVLHGLRGYLARGPERIDLRLAISVDAGECNLQLAWLGGVHMQAPVPRALSLSASYSF
jgi:uncharacterized protein (TIGR02001 family)